jgi:hypothetical protein
MKVREYALTSLCVKARLVSTGAVGEDLAGSPRGMTGYGDQGGVLGSKPTSSAYKVTRLVFRFGVWLAGGGRLAACPSASAGLRLRCGGVSGLTRVRR